MDSMTKTSLVAGNLVSGSSQPAPATFDDLLETLLFAQLVCDEQTHRFSAPEQWFAEYRRVLQKLKWYGTDVRSETFTPEENSTFTIASLVERALLDRVTGAQAEGVRKLMTCVAGLSETSQEQLLLRHSVMEAFIDGWDDPGEPPPANRVALLMSVVGQNYSLSSLFITFITTNAFSQDIFNQPLGGGSIVGVVGTRFFQHQWDAAKYLEVRPNVREFLAGRQNGLILPICCEGGPVVTAPDNPEFR